MIQRAFGRRIRRIGRLLCAAGSACWLLLALPGCNTVEVMGEDIEAAGSELDEAAEEAG